MEGNEAPANRRRDALTWLCLAAAYFLSISSVMWCIFSRCRPRTVSDLLCIRYINNEACLPACPPGTRRLALSSFFRPCRYPLPSLYVPIPPSLSPSLSFCAPSKLGP